RGTRTEELRAGGRSDGKSHSGPTPGTITARPPPQKQGNIVQKSVEATPRVQGPQFLSRGAMAEVFWARPERGTRGPKPAHSRDEVAAAAVRVADAAGLDAGTTRRLAADA